MRYYKLSMLFVLFILITSAYPTVTPLLDAENLPSVVQSIDGMQGDEDSVNYFNKNPKTDGVEGMSVDKAYEELPIKEDVEPIIVAVVDGGVDIEHEDLKGKIWMNTDEVAGDGIDNDENGYVDDVFGWNFIGGADGDNINEETLEVTREYIRYQMKLEKGVELTPEEKEYYEKIEKEFTRNRAVSTAAVDLMGPLAEKITEMKILLEESYGITDFSAESLKSYEGTEDEALYAIAYLSLIHNILESTTLPGAYANYYKRQAEYWYNEEVDVRNEVVGDDPSNFDDLVYGNNDVAGPDAGHGTHVAGIITAIRDNELGIRGVANDVLIMSVRTVPNGDERDKDVAAAIRYAVDNGAKIINMSFGKAYSPYKDEVDAAFQYAQDNGVLIIHAAGNDDDNSDSVYNYPNQFIGNNFNSKFDNWIVVGANTSSKDENLVANFSNYGILSVDVFAPGFKIRSTTPSDTYGTFNGTSMAAPMVSGVAALIWSQFPDLEYDEVKELILSTVRVYNFDVIVPGSDGVKAPFNTLSVTGGVVDAYNALQKIMEEEGMLD